ncbi:YaaW family protein [Nodularia spumigena]|uniref:YaaW family protein n=1 Tax=Nodularia spumigena UHCC 0060 TaxID=3110300 RepID=A0ABU5UUH7_NODSP|nr:YaaW family protein [Nodularia spumigena]MEA5527420.1 YaaW family protein [Nodularia spumigena UHCC 0143]MEA5609964.1 YaaW family protein [Nodularia spumigena UHCC 0060]MEA5613305.1 YaaW family protein [Nodularia spumigena UHCC 0040]
MDELRAALELATEEELQDLTAILFSRKFNPLDYVHTPEPIEVQSQNHKAWLDTLENRFRFLAADGMTVLRGRTSQVTYRQALIQVCKYLKIPYSTELTTVDLEAELFLHLLGQVWKKLPENEKQKLNAQVQRQLSESDLKQPLPLLLQRDPLGLLVKGGSALAVTSILQPLVLQQIARQFAIHFAKYQVAQQTAIAGSQAAATQFKGYVALQMARRGMTMNAARYGAVRSVFTFIGPVMWTWFFADLGWRAIATNYGRIIPTIFALAQIRLTRGEYWEPA